MLSVIASFLAVSQDLPDSFAMYGDGKDPSNNRVRVVDSVCLDTSRLTVIYSAYLAVQ